MAGSKVSGYAIGDTNFDNMMLTLDKAYKGKMSLSLTEYTTATIPEIAAGSWADVNGALFKFDSNEAISTTDPVNGGTAADGTVYITLVPSGDSCTAGFVDTAPTWSDSKQGYYYTGDYANYRVVGRATKATASYTLKAVYNFRTSLNSYITYDSMRLDEDLTVDDDLTVGGYLGVSGGGSISGGLAVFGAVDATEITGEIELSERDTDTLFSGVSSANITVYKPVTVVVSVGTKFYLTNSSFSSEVYVITTTTWFGALNPGYYKATGSSNCNLVVYGAYGQDGAVNINNAITYS